MTFTDTHCHIHETRYDDPEGALARAAEQGVKRLICVGTDEDTSNKAVVFARKHENVWASVGLHPHDATSGAPTVEKLEELLKDDKNVHVPKIVAIGECGLDYFYEHSPKDTQVAMLEAQLDLATRYNLPVIFHVREAFDDFWPILSNFQGIRGVLHSFTDTMSNMEKGLSLGLYVGVNGIATFSKDEKQRKMFATIPVNSLLLETDSPFLTPVPHRGIVNEPAFMTHVAHYLANLQAINLEELSRATERNATTLFFTKTNIKP
ncbi:MAG: TatD family hydrolase [Candidatus Saccharimonadales bacterium]